MSTGEVFTVMEDMLPLPLLSFFNLKKQEASDQQIYWFSFYIKGPLKSQNFWFNLSAHDDNLHAQIIKVYFEC